MSENRAIILWGSDGAMGGKVTIHPMGNPTATIIEISLTFHGLENVDYWLGRARHEIESIFHKEFQEIQGKWKNEQL